MKSPMLGRKATMFVVAMLVASLAISAIGLLNVPPRAWPYIPRNSKAVFAIVSDWIWPPLFLGLLLLLSPFFRRFYKLRAVPDDHRRWFGRYCGVGAVIIVGNQLLQTAAVFAHWHREAHHLAPPAPGATFLGLLPDPHHLLGRAVLAASGVFFVWAGNGLAKLLPPVRDRLASFDRGKVYRLQGWIMVVGGAAATLFAFLLPYPRPAWVVVLLTDVAMAALMVTVELPLWRGRGAARTAPEGEAW
jgi:hypothetical protein